MRKSLKSTLAVLAAATTIPLVFATAGSATDIGGLELVTNGNANSDHPSMSDDGRFVVFYSSATDLPGAGGTTNKNIFLHDRSAGTITALTSAGGRNFPKISGNGKYIVYTENGTTNQAIVRLDITDPAAPIALTIADGNGDSFFPEVANNGDVVFESEATNLAAADVTADNGVFLYSGGTITSVADGNINSSLSSVSIADDSSLIAYSQGDGTNDQIFTYDVAGATSTQRTNGNGASVTPAVSADGSMVAFGSYAGNIPGTGIAGPGTQNVMVWSAGGFKALTNGNGSSKLADISANGAYVAFSSAANDLVASSDVNGGVDFFRAQVSDGATVRLSTDTSPNASQGYITMNGDGSLGAFSTRDDGEIPGMNANGNVIVWGLSLVTPTSTTSTTAGSTTSTTAGTTPSTVPQHGGRACKPSASDRVEFQLTSDASERNIMWRAYCVALDRRPDKGGFDYWLGIKQQGYSWEFIEAFMADSVEFRNTYGSLNNEAFIERIYDVIMDRGFDQEGKTYWTGLLENGRLDRGGVLFYFSDSQEFKNMTETA